MSEEGEVAAIQRKIIGAALVDHLAHRRVLGLEHRSGGGDFHGFGHASGLELEIDQNSRARVHGDVRLDFRLEALGGNVNLVTPNPHRAELVVSRASSRGG